MKHVDYGDQIYPKFTKHSDTSPSRFPFSCLDIFFLQYVILSFVYDAVMLQAMSRCQADLLSDEQREKLKGGKGARVKVSKHMETLLYYTNFTGSSGPLYLPKTGRRGQISFYQDRALENFTYGAYNFRENGSNGSIDYHLVRKSIDDVRKKAQGLPVWVPASGGSFVYANNLTVPPLLNRESIRVTGLVFASILVFLSLASGAWVTWNCNKTEVRMNQLVFFVLLCVGSAILGSTIFALSFDEGAGWDEDQLDRACMATPWLAVTGYNTIYLALFCKLMRLDSLLQFRRKTVKAYHVLWPFIVMLLTSVSILIAWTLGKPLRYVVVWVLTLWSRFLAIVYSVVTISETVVNFERYSSHSRTRFSHGQQKDNQKSCKDLSVK